MLEHEAIQTIVNNRTVTNPFPDLEEKDKVAPDSVNHPTHYTSHPSGIEAIEITSKFPFALGNAIKYLMRSQYKVNRIEDLKKARWYLEYHSTHWAKVFETFELHLILAQFQRTVGARRFERSPEDNILLRLFNIWSHDILAAVNPASEFQKCIGEITLLIEHLEGKLKTK